MVKLSGLMECILYSTMKIDSKNFCSDGFGFRAPVPYQVKGNEISIFFGKYITPKFAEIYSVTLLFKYLEYDGICSSWEVSSFDNKPTVRAGDKQTYSENGIVPSCWIRHKHNGLLFTIGFSNLNQHYFNAESGLVIFDEQMKIIENLNGPVLSRSYEDPYWAASPFVIKNKGKKSYSMFYTSAYGTIRLANGNTHHRYSIKKRTSIDLKNWHIELARNVIVPKNVTEYAIARPTIIRLKGKYVMFYSKRETIYSKDYLTFISVSDNLEGWHNIEKPFRFFEKMSEYGCECYAYPILHRERLLIFFNVHGYGKEGGYLYSISINSFMEWIQSNQALE